MKKIILLLSLLIFTSAYAGMSNSDKKKAWECSGIYMANYFLPSGEQFEYSIDRKSTRLNSSHSQQSRMPSSA